MNDNERASLLTIIAVVTAIVGILILALSFQQSLQEDDNSDDDFMAKYASSTDKSSHESNSNSNSNSNPDSSSSSSSKYRSRQDQALDICTKYAKNYYYPAKVSVLRYGGQEVYDNHYSMPMDLKLKSSSGGTRKVSVICMTYNWSADNSHGEVKFFTK